MVECTDHQVEAKKRVRQGGSGIPPCRTFFRCGTDFSSLRWDVSETVAAQRFQEGIFFVYRRNQASTDRAELASLLNISENQLSYITNVDAGRGLIKCGSAIVPFVNSFPKNTHLYRLMSTKFMENGAA